MHRDPCNHFAKLQLRIQVALYLASTSTGSRNYKLLCGAKVVLAQGTWFGRRSDSPILTFWRLELSLNEHDVLPKDLQQPVSDFS